MPSSATPNRRVLVILDPDYGERLREDWPGVPVWIVMSPVNEPVVRSLSTTESVPDHLTSITGIRYDRGVVPEKYFLTQLGMIDLHHGAYSSPEPYRLLEVIGVSPTLPICDALSELGFKTVCESQTGFVAMRRSVLRASMKSLEPLLLLLVEALHNPSTCERAVRQFQTLYWDGSQQPKAVMKSDATSAKVDEILGDLAYDLDFFEPDPNRCEVGFYGHERAEKEIKAALGRLSELGIAIPNVP